MKLPNASSFSLLDNSTEFLCGITDSELRILHSNKLFKKHFGLIKDQGKGKSFHEVIQSFQVEKFIQAREKSINNPGKVVIIEIKSYHEHEEHWFKWEVTAVADEHKKIAEISFIGTDITRQKKVEQELLKQGILLDSISDAVISTDLNFCIKSWNLSSEMLFGFKPDDVLNRPITDFFSVTTLYISNKEVFDIILKKGFWKGEVILKKGDGKRIFMLSAISLIKNEQGVPSGFISVNQDTSKEKRAKEELVIKKEEFNSFMENTSTLAWITDEHGKLYYTNSLYKKIYGISDEVIGKNIYDYFPKELTKGWKVTDIEVLNSNSKIEAIEQGIDKNGNEVYYQVYKFPVQTLSGKRLIGGQAIDITAKTTSRRELEKEKNRFISFMENTPSLAWINDEDGKLIYMNSLFKNAFSISDDVIGNNIFDYYPESMRPACKASDEMVLETNSNVEVFEEGIDLNGNTIYYQVFKFPVNTSDGKRLIGGQAIDITAKTVSREELIREKNQFISFMENGPLLAWMVDENGEMHYMNSKFKSVSKFTNNHLGKDNLHLYPEPLRKKAKESIFEVMSGNKTIEYQNNCIDDEGKTRYFNISKFPILSSGSKRYVGGQAFEVTEIINANELLIKEKKQFESFMENAPLLAWIVDEDGVLHYMNSKFKASFNYTGDSIGKKIAQHYPANFRERALLTNLEVLQKNKPVEFLQDWTDENGKIHYYRIRKFPMHSIDGKRLIGGQSEDITDELMVKKELEAMHERFEFAGKATRDVIWDWDFNTNKIQRFGGSNAFFNYRDVGDLMDFDNDNIHPDDAQVAEDSLQAAINSTDNRWMSEFRYKCAEGTYKTVIDQAYIIRDKTGKAVRIIGSMQDVTEERRLQKEVMDAKLKKKQDTLTAVLEAQEAERKELSEELHDNVNQLLAVSLLFLKTVEKQNADAGGLIMQSIKHIDKAITEIRNISHALNPDALKYNGITIALNELADGLQIPGKLLVKFTSIDFRDDLVSKDLQLALYRIVQEQINNILKHAEAAEINIELSQLDETTRLKISDNGKGFDLATAKKGLGINNIFNRAEGFGGTAELITSPSNGCTLIVLIPLA